MVERTLIVIKPDGIKRGLIGEMIKRIERTGLKIIAMKMIWVDKDFAKKHYFDISERHGKRVFENLVSYLTEGPVVAICFEGVGAISLARKIIGSTYPNEANPGTIRGDFCHISKAYADRKKKKVGNLIHSSANEKEAKKEIALWFSVDDIHNYKTSHQEEVF
jgi:nucleoside-diphosphate kinase